MPRRNVIDDIAADLARQREELARGIKERENAGEEVADVLQRIAELRERMERNTTPDDAKHPPERKA